MCLCRVCVGKCDVAQGSKRGLCALIRPGATEALHLPRLVQLMVNNILALLPFLQLSFSHHLSIFINQSSRIATQAFTGHLATLSQLSLINFFPPRTAVSTITSPTPLQADHLHALPGQRKFSSTTTRPTHSPSPLRV